ncbi:Actin [Hexamita inflata]|uniref:Actin n=1 Tax=Hexamita inflata TaxID=28002 RepID=A0AA86UAI3_9EUKA|nr:Actin [Hexamita inflata]
MNPTLIMDIGSSCIKLGSSSNDQVTVIPNCIGKTILRNGSVQNEMVIGRDVINNKQHLELQYPVQNGQITDFDALKTIIKHELELIEKLESIIISGSVQDKYQLQVLAFQCGFKRVCVMEQPILALLTHNITSGLIVDIGATQTRITPVYENQILRGETLQLGGDSITTQLSNQLRKRGYNLSHLDFEPIQQLKEQHCFFSEDLAADSLLAKETTFFTQEQIVNKKRVRANSELFIAPEIFFNPHIAGFEYLPLQSVIYKVIQQQPIDVKSDLMQNIILTGQSTHLPGLKSKLQTLVQREFENGAKTGFRGSIRVKRIYNDVNEGARIMCANQFGDWAEM